MLHPSRLIRLAVLGSVALLVRAVVREANGTREAATLLPPPLVNGKGGSRRPRPRRTAR